MKSVGHVAIMEDQRLAKIRTEEKKKNRLSGGGMK